MMYIEFESEQKAMAISELLYSIFSPIGVETKYLFGGIVHPVNGKFMAVINDEQQQPVYHKDNLDELLDALEAELGAAISRTELTGLGQYIRSTNRITIGDIIPAYFKQNQLTREDIYTLGYAKKEL